MFWKRQVPTAIVLVVGLLTLFGWFVDQEAIRSFVEDDSTQWYDVIASFAIVLGALNLIKLQGIKILRRKKDWPYALLAIAGFLFAVVAGFVVKGQGEEWGAHLLSSSSVFFWLFSYIFTPLQATMFALLAFYVASASYRAFRIRNFEASLLLGAGILIMLGRVPIGSKISPWFVAYVVALGLGILSSTVVRDRRVTLGVVVTGILGVTIAGVVSGWPADQPAFLILPALQEWIYLVPNAAGARAIMIGIALGMVGTSLRVILGIEKSFMGEK